MKCLVLSLVASLALGLGSAQAAGGRVVVRGGVFGGRTVVVNGGGSNVVVARNGVFGGRSVIVNNGAFVPAVNVQSFQSFGSCGSCFGSRVLIVP